MEHLPYDQFVDLSQNQTQARGLLPASMALMRLQDSVFLISEQIALTLIKTYQISDLLLYKQSQRLHTCLSYLMYLWILPVETMMVPNKGY